MKRIAILIILIAFVTGSGRLIADPGPSGECRCPRPAGGMQNLERNAVYPNMAQRCAFQGEVIVQFRVDKEGKISQVRIVQSAGPIFDQSAKEAIERTKWKPALQNGEPVAVEYAQAFRYNYRY